MGENGRSTRTQRAWLFNERWRRFTPHEYAGLAPAEFVPAAPVLPGSNWEAHEVLYRCTETGTVRRWGIE